MSAQHTPGPWSAGKIGNSQIFDLIGPNLTGRGRELVGDFRASQNRETNEANARLIAAAPDLLAALEALKDWGCTYTGPCDANSPHELLVAAHHAIAKAKGGAS